MMVFCRRGLWRVLLMGLGGRWGSWWRVGCVVLGVVGFFVGVDGRCRLDS